MKDLIGEQKPQELQSMPELPLVEFPEELFSGIYEAYSSDPHAQSRIRRYFDSKVLTTLWSYSVWFTKQMITAAEWADYLDSLILNAPIFIGAPEERIEKERRVYLQITADTPVSINGIKYPSLIKYFLDEAPKRRSIYSEN